MLFLSCLLNSPGYGSRDEAALSHKAQHCIDTANEVYYELINKENTSPVNEKIIEHLENSLGDGISLRKDAENYLCKLELKREKLLKTLQQHSNEKESILQNIEKAELNKVNAETNLSAMVSSIKDSRNHLSELKKRLKKAKENNAKREHTLNDIAGSQKNQINDTQLRRDFEEALINIIKMRKASIQTKMEDTYTSERGDHGREESSKQHEETLDTILKEKEKTFLAKINKSLAIKKLISKIEITIIQYKSFLEEVEQKIDSKYEMVDLIEYSVKLMQEYIKFWKCFNNAAKNKAKRIFYLKCMSNVSEKINYSYVHTNSFMTYTKNDIPVTASLMKGYDLKFIPC